MFDITKDNITYYRSLTCISTYLLVLPASTFNNHLKHKKNLVNYYLTTQKVLIKYMPIGYVIRINITNPSTSHSLKPV